MYLIPLVDVMSRRQNATQIQNASHTSANFTYHQITSVLYIDVSFIKLLSNFSWWYKNIDANKTPRWKLNSADSKYF